MIQLIKDGVYFYKGKMIVNNEGNIPEIINSTSPEVAKTGTISYKILSKHNTSGDISNLKLKFDAMASHDITYVGIIQTARASGLKEFPVPYVLTNCHNSLCAVGGTINEDDHAFGLSAAKKYGGIYVPAHQAVIHQYMREMMAACGSMILGSDSHTRYGALGTMAIGEGGPELVKQLLSRTYDIKYPGITGVYLGGSPKPGVGPQDVAIAIIGAVFKNGFVKNNVLEFVGPGIEGLSIDYRNGIDVMTTETTCLSSIWCTDDKVKKYLKLHGREAAYSTLQPDEVAYYDNMIKVDLSSIEPMIALPFHPSNAYTILEFNQNAADILRQTEIEGQIQIDNPSIKFNLTDKLVNGKLIVDQGIVAGCAGGMFENLEYMAGLLKGRSIGNDTFSLSVYPASQPIYLEIVKSGIAAELLMAGATIRSAFCGPCFGAGDVPGNNEFSIRHSTRNFNNREGSKPGDGQISSVALMDARSIAATAVNGGILTSAIDLEIPESKVQYHFDKTIYENRIYQGYGKAQMDKSLKFGPNIEDWPVMANLTDNILLKVATVIKDPVTTTDELIPSGETSSYRSNPYRLAEFTLSRKDPKYVSRAKAVKALEDMRIKVLAGDIVADSLNETEAGKILVQVGANYTDTGIGSVIYANKPGDGSAREQAASCQKVLGGWANIALEYATKRYRSNLMNWGMIPFTIDESEGIPFETEDYIFIRGIRQAILNGDETIQAEVIKTKSIYEPNINDTNHENGRKIFTLKIADVSKNDRDIIASGCLMNYYAQGN